MPKLKWDYHTIRRTNEPGTCLYCGRRLPIYRGDTTSLFRSYREGDEEWQARIEEKEKEGWVLKRMKSEGSDAYFQKVIPRRGVYGHGAFHSGLCAQWFGLAFARQDYRLVPYNTDEEKDSQDEN
jgi:hypothetical protein